MPGIGGGSGRFLGRDDIAGFLLDAGLEEEESREDIAGSLLDVGLEGEEGRSLTCSGDLN